MWYFGWLFIVLMIIVIGLIVTFILNDAPEGEAGPLFCLIVVVLGLWLGAAVHRASGQSSKMDFYDETSIVEDTTIIKSAALNSELSGTFFLGIGSVDEEKSYQYYQVDDSVTFKLSFVPVDKTRIREVEVDSTFVPHIVSYYYTRGEQYYCWFVRAMVNADAVEKFDNIKHLKEHIIYVPKGTIVGDVSKLNLK